MIRTLWVGCGCMWRKTNTYLHKEWTGEKNTTCLLLSRARGTCVDQIDHSRYYNKRGQLHVNESMVSINTLHGSTSFSPCLLKNSSLNHERASEVSEWIEIRPSLVFLVRSRHNPSFDRDWPETGTFLWPFIGRLKMWSFFMAKKRGKKWCSRRGRGRGRGRGRVGEQERRKVDQWDLRHVHRSNVQLSLYFDEYSSRRISRNSRSNSNSNSTSSVV